MKNIFLIFVTFTNHFHCYSKRWRNYVQLLHIYYPSVDLHKSVLLVFSKSHYGIFVMVSKAH